MNFTSIRIAMTVSEFNKLTLDKKADFVMEWGYFVGKKQKSEGNIVVYYLGNFLAEVSYLFCETRKIEVVKNVELKKYLTQFDYKNLFFIRTLTGIQSNIPS